jgi:hypothetical protein
MDICIICCKESDSPRFNLCSKCYYEEGLEEDRILYMQELAEALQNDIDYAEEMAEEVEEDIAVEIMGDAV